MNIPHEAIKLLLDKIDRHVRHASYQDDTKEAYLIVSEWAEYYSKPKVVIEVSGGVAECTSCPDEVEVEIIDHDNEEAEEEDCA